MRLAILGNPNGWYALQLKKAASQLSDFEIDVLSFEYLRTAIDKHGNPSIYSRRLVAHEKDQATNELHHRIEPDALLDVRVDGNYDAILVRTMPMGSLEQVIFRMNALHMAHSMGVKTINAPKTLEISIDKWLTLDYCRRESIDVPATICCQDRDAAVEAYHLLGRDVVVKPIFGGEGRGIVRVDNDEMAWRVFGTLSQIGAVMYVQERLEHRGYDIRILCIGDEAYCVSRSTAPGDWRTNISQGGQANRYEPTPQQMDIARKAKACIHADVVGVDILPTRDGRDVLLEVNAVPGWKGTQAALDIDLTSRVIQYLQS